ncbi:MAG: hypothetical protein AAFY88_02255, partial [Acidobacteriota bacterium]
KRRALRAALEGLNGRADDLARAALARRRLGPDASLFPELAQYRDLDPALGTVRIREYLHRDFPRPALRHVLEMEGALSAASPFLRNELELLSAQVYLDLNRFSEASRHLRRAVASDPPMTPGQLRRLETIGAHIPPEDPF